MKRGETIMRKGYFSILAEVGTKSAIALKCRRLCSALLLSFFCLKKELSL
jgi:hypothetical protein